MSDQGYENCYRCGCLLEGKVSPDRGFLAPSIYCDGCWTKMTACTDIVEANKPKMDSLIDAFTKKCEAINAEKTRLKFENQQLRKYLEDIRYLVSLALQE